MRKVKSWLQWGVQRSANAYRRLKKAWKANACEQTWEEFRASRNYKGTLIKKALRQAYRTKVVEAFASEKGM